MEPAPSDRIACCGFSPNNLLHLLLNNESPVKIMRASGAGVAACICNSASQNQNTGIFLRRLSASGVSCRVAQTDAKGD
eukprot:scaffold55881_cov77-Cyclotella_meneghiniana.AAC.3